VSKKYLVIVFSLFLTIKLFANQNFSLNKQNLEDALKKIAIKVNMSYVANGKFLKDKTSNEIKNVRGLSNALLELLRETGLKAEIKNNIILITKEVKKEKSLDIKTKKDSQELGELLVQGEWIGNSSLENVRFYSGTRTLINSEKLNKLASKNIEEVLRIVPGVQVQDETGTGILPNISVRGLKPGRSAHLNALVNGIPAAIAPYSHSSFSLFPITKETLESIDIVRGGSAVHYGPNNVGGVVNFITKPINNELKSTVKISADIAENGNVLTDTYFRTGGFINDELGLQLQYNGVKGESFREHSNTKITNVILDSEYFPTDNSEIKTNLQYYKGKADLPGALLPEAYEKDDSSSQRPYDKFDGETARTSIVYKVNPSDDIEYHLMTFAQYSKRKFDWGWNTLGLGALPNTEDAIRTANRKVKVFGSEPRLSFQKENHKVIFGARFINENVDYLVNESKLDKNITDVLRNWDIKTNAFAAYISDTISFMDGRVKFTPGIRYEQVHTYFKDNINPLSDKKKNMKSLLPGISIGYEASNSVFLFTNAQRSLRAPQVAQVRKNGELESELAWNYELGLRYKLNDVFSMNSTLYRINYEDQIEYDSSTETFKNLGKTRHQGLEMQFILRPRDNSSFTFAYNYLDTEQLTGLNKGKKLPWVASHQISLSSDYSFKNHNFNLTGIYLSKAYSDSKNTKEELKNGQVGEIPSYMLWNAKYSSDIQIFNNKKTSFTFGINNIFDEAYYFRGIDVSPIGRVSGQRRSFSVSAQIDF